MMASRYTKLATVFCVLVDAQPKDWPLMSKIPEAALRGASSDVGSMGDEWTPASTVDGEQVVSWKVEKEFLLDVEAALGRKLPGGKDDHFAEILESLQPTFLSLDKNEYGKLGHTAVRYALHRLFVARHGWFIDGLDPAGRHFNSTSPIQVLSGKVNAHAQGLFEKRLGGKGFGVQELAVFAALLEDLISQEAVDNLQNLFKLFNVAADEVHSTKAADEFIDLYMTKYILGDKVEGVSVKQLRKTKNHMHEIYSGWAQTQKFVRKLRQDVLGDRDHISLPDIRKVVVKIGEQFGQVQNLDCHTLKTRLIGLETGEKGCVPFSSFYAPSVKSDGDQWQMEESPEYLKQLGIVDDSNPNNMKVMVPNYLNSPVNCISTSAYYSVCCIDECDNILGRIERHVRGPSATPLVLSALVSKMSSSTEPGNRTLTFSQMRRLNSIAEKHDGQVPIHGRLFMQWMHTVYPRECAYPHMSGTTTPALADDWEESTGKQSGATKEFMKQMTLRRHQDVGSSGTCGKWVDEEELFVPTIAPRRTLQELETDFHTWVATGSVALLCSLVAILLAVMSTLSSLKKKLASKSRGKNTLMVI
jgi:hypothetical protein|mmetsp:Transcript_28654/g.46121  ORF Transcript_28654/g.46121 Transcript_28654/m.46121 type:complete len:587 (+) Transcript_28654:110-1870(+)